MTLNTILPIEDNSDDLELAIRTLRNSSHGEGVVVARDDILGARRANSYIPRAGRVQSVQHDDCETRPLLAGPQLVAADLRRSKYIEDETWRPA